MRDEHLTRRHFVQIVATGLAAGTVGAQEPEVASANRPNFVVILTDDQVYRAIGYANPAVKTPHLDALAQSGVIFDRAYVATPICAASRASLLTGVYPQQHGAIALDSTGFRKHSVDSRRYPTLAQVLADAGYRTMFCGKSHLGEPRDYGFQQGGEHKALDDGESFAAADAFLREGQAEESPFLLWLATHQPHIPLVPEDRWLDLYAESELEVDPNFRESPPPGSLYNQGLPGEQYYRDSSHSRNYGDAPSGPPRSRETMRTFLKGYYATISQLDAQVGRLVETLKATGQYENTVIVFLGDNGYLLGNHGLGNKITMHEESVRVPMFIHAPALIQRPYRTDGLASSLDVYPTILDIAGLEAPDHLEGRSLRPVLDTSAVPWREHVFSECVGVGGEPGMGHRMVRGDRWKYVLTGVGDEALFDEAADPYEMTNLAADPAHRDVLVTLRETMRAWMDRVGDDHARPPES